MSQAPQSSSNRQSGHHPGKPAMLEQKEDRHRGRQVCINFNEDTMSYYIQDLGIGLGTYMRINYESEPYVLQDN